MTTVCSIQKFKTKILILILQQRGTLGKKVDKKDGGAWNVQNVADTVWATETSVQVLAHHHHPAERVTVFGSVTAETTARISGSML